MITYWKGRIEPGVSDALVSQVDMLSSLASLVGSEIRGKDSRDLMDLFLGHSQVGRDQLVLEATSRTAFRMGDWVMIPPYEGPAVNILVNIELGNSDAYQLYDLREDIGQQNNLAETRPDKLRELIDTFREVRGDEYGEIEQLELK